MRPVQLFQHEVIPKMPASRLNQVFQVTGQHEPFGQASYRAKRCSELDSINHCGARRILTELMPMPEPSKWSFDLLIYEIVR